MPVPGVFQSGFQPFDEYFLDLTEHAILKVGVEIQNYCIVGRRLSGYIFQPLQLLP